MTTDNLTNEPKQTKAKSSQDFVFTEAQVEAAAREWYEQANGYETWASASGKHQQVVKVRAAKALVAAASVVPQAESVPGKRLSPEFRADLVEAARDRIQAVWDDVPEGVDAETMAQNVVSAQEFFWLTHAFPAVQQVSESDLAENLEHWIFQYNQERITLKTFARAVLAALDGAPESKWEYGEIGPANQVHMTTPERVRKSEALGWSQEIVRRYTAGPWVSVKVGDIGE